MANNLKIGSVKAAPRSWLTYGRTDLPDKLANGKPSDTGPQRIEGSFGERVAEMPAYGEPVSTLFRPASMLEFLSLKSIRCTSNIPMEPQAAILGHLIHQEVVSCFTHDLYVRKKALLIQPRLCSYDSRTPPASSSISRSPVSSEPLLSTRGPVQL